jgi:hypothetical protein
VRALNVQHIVQIGRECDEYLSLRRDAAKVPTHIQQLMAAAMQTAAAKLVAFRSRRVGKHK